MKSVSPLEETAGPEADEDPEDPDGAEPAERVEPYKKAN